MILLVDLYPLSPFPRGGKGGPFNLHFTLLTLSPWERVAVVPERSAALSYAEMSKERPGEVKFLYFYHHYLYLSKLKISI
jgi:hypothetical protein